VEDVQANPIPGKQKQHSLLFRIFFGRNPKRTAIRAVALIVVSYVVFGFILLPVRISGISMEPTYHDRSFNFVNRLSFAWSKPKRGDIVALRFSDVRVRPVYMKRIIGLPGEKLEIRSGVVFIDGRPLDEPYVKERELWDVPVRVLGGDEYFVIGDNRGMPAKFHYFGVKDSKEILGKVLW
jgi:signal peptidase I